MKETIKLGIVFRYTACTLENKIFLFFFLLRLTEEVKTYKIAKKTIDCSFYFASRSVDLNKLYYRLLTAKQRTYSIAYKRKKKEDNNIFFIYADEDSNIIKLLDKLSIRVSARF